jgi:Tfp pilus assembly protein PilN
MIRINLLHVRARKGRRKVSGLVPVLVLLVVILAEIATIVVVHVGAAGEVDENAEKLDQENAALMQQRAGMASGSAKRAELDAIRKRQEVISELQAGRSGPVDMLRELMIVVSRNGRPSMTREVGRRFQQQADAQGFDTNWDYRKIWIQKFVEIDRIVTIEGVALDVDDIGQFQLRLNLSRYFEDVRWVRSPEGQVQESGVPIYAFTLKGAVRYRVEDESAPQSSTQTPPQTPAPAPAPAPEQR